MKKEQIRKVAEMQAEFARLYEIAADETAASATREDAKTALIAVARALSELAKLSTK